MKTTKSNLSVNNQINGSLDSDIKLYSEASEKALKIYNADAKPDTTLSVAARTGCGHCNSEKAETEKSFNEGDIFYDSFKQYIKTLAEIKKFAKHLVGLAGEIPTAEEEQLFTFLETSLCYMMLFLPEKSFTLKTLLLLSTLLRTEQTDKYSPFSLFDIFIKESLSKKNNQTLNILRKYYTDFKKHENENTPKTICKHMATITNNYSPY
ncbi:MAG: hypothetical protein IKC01_05800 [Clostridia bacterium]|nr:hypothetical protein [Clostridia bacterium]